MNDNCTPTTIYLRTEVDVDKLALFLRMQARRVRFWVDPRLVDRVLEWLERFAREHPWRIAVEIVRPDGQKLLSYVAGGAAVGAAVGGLFGGLAGSAAGAALGGAAGAALAHVQVRIELTGETGALVTLR